MAETKTGYLVVESENGTVSSLIRRLRIPDGNVRVSDADAAVLSFSVTGGQATALGDSLTKGTTGPSDLAHSYAHLLADRQIWTLTNLGVDGAMAGDANPFYALQPTNDNTQYWMQLGTNDQRIYGTSDVKLARFKEAHAALVAFLAIPHANKTLGSNTTKITYTGTWTASSAWTTVIGRSSISSPGSTATFKVSGTVIFIGTLVQNSNAAFYTIAVDGGPARSYFSGPGAVITTYLGKTYLPRLITIAGLAEGEHTVVLTYTSGSGVSDAVYIDWVAGNGALDKVDLPNVYVGNFSRFTAAGYTANGGSDANVYAYCAAIRANVEQLQSYGLNVTLVDILNVINPATDLISDGVHWNDTANDKAAEAYRAAMNTRALARDRQAHAFLLPGTRTVESSATPLIDFSQGRMQTLTLTATVTAVTWMNIPPGQIVEVRLVQGGSGSYTFAWGTTVKWVGGTAPTLSTTVGKIDKFLFSSPDAGYTMEEVGRFLDVR